MGLPKPAIAKIFYNALRDVLEEQDAGRSWTWWRSNWTSQWTRKCVESCRLGYLSLPFRSDRRAKVPGAPCPARKMRMKHVPFAVNVRWLALATELSLEGVGPVNDPSLLEPST